MGELAQSANAALTAKDTLFELQVEQHQHDEVYHREIARLSLHQRLNHMALHFAKYSGKVAAAAHITDIAPIYTDILIIGLSTANILNVSAWDILDHNDQQFAGLVAYGRWLAHRYRGIAERDELLRETSVAMGRIAAACEKIDHLEEIPFRAEIKQGLATLIALSLAILASQGIEPASAVRARLQAVKQRLRLHGRI